MKSMQNVLYLKVIKHQEKVEAGAMEQFVKTDNLFPGIIGTATLKLLKALCPKLLLLQQHRIRIGISNVKKVNCRLDWTDSIL